jgi:hypothetical protein
MCLVVLLYNKNVVRFTIAAVARTMILLLDDDDEDV